MDTALNTGRRDRVIVTGASSQLGVFLLPRLQAAGFRVLALSRNAPASPVDISESVRWLRSDKALAPACCLVSCGPLELARTLAEQTSGLQRVVAFSTSSVLTKARSDNPEESRQMAEILAHERLLRATCDIQGIALALIRPTMIYGCGLDRNISLLAAFGRRFGFIPVSSSAGGLRQPVHADDLAALALACLSSETALSLESVACGGSTLSYCKMMEKTAAAGGKDVSILKLNPRLFSFAASLASLVPGFKGLNPEMVRRQGRDMVFDDSELREKLNYQPRPFEPAPADLQVPGFARELQLTG
ncbi:MAG: NAD-dependent dehydratase [Xanthomonadales bacterium]|nr:NAD-dependent dehydratase [Gammaproteobacteria bacterium]MBT8052610.1 NAD-dependent dehydratase [Gammaproteobacteria bacterium]NND56631.1 NAD-dependent dehydratase [Xanthomonadales bacterium]NNK52427.1 NAD-dependent dehydratase [Xanthomonadales bacterium]